MEWDTFALTTAVIPVVFFASSTYIPGIMRKIQARIQLRIGPPILTPGFWAIFKFIYKERITPVSPMPRLYHALPVIGIFLMFFILLLTTPAWSGVLGLATLVAIAGLVKVEEALYIFMGNLSQSILSVRMPYPDRIKGAIMKGATRRSFEQVAALRTFKLISIGSFPLYLGMFV
ncbi:MAG: NADH-quinone oxidoreductase subunit H, partial [Candidatus Methanofastidiosa archaeon]|nr:NADH-quinone oxidoreductase subunit H [Candidatus Methanofastidiosa archaeon]